MAKNFRRHQNFLLRSLIQNRKILLQKNRHCYYSHRALQAHQKKFL
nr:MAG TPA: hypothetical protein [Bacteriophage sp.]